MYKKIFSCMSEIQIPYINVSWKQSLFSYLPFGFIRIQSENPGGAVNWSESDQIRLDISDLNLVAYKACG